MPRRKRFRRGILRLGSFPVNGPGALARSGRRSANWTSGPREIDAKPGFGFTTPSPCRWHFAFAPRRGAWPKAVQTGHSPSLKPRCLPRRSQARLGRPRQVDLWGAPPREAATRPAPRRVFAVGFRVPYSEVWEPRLLRRLLRLLRLPRSGKGTTAPTTSTTISCSGSSTAVLFWQVR